MAVLCASNPALNVLDILSKLTHDPDKEVAHNSIFALGIMGAGTNHARIAGMLRHLAQYYSRSKDALFVVRVAQVRTSFLFFILSHFYVYIFIFKVLGFIGEIGMEFRSNFKVTSNLV